jgi:hypothetical protein
MPLEGARPMAAGSPGVDDVSASAPVVAARPVVAAPADGVPAEAGRGTGGDQSEGTPLVVREKTHEAEPMRLEDALSNMELVGHDFYLFLDVDLGLPSVVYRRVGYDYGVIRLTGPTAAGRPRPASVDQPDERSVEEREAFASSAAAL